MKNATPPKLLTESASQLAQAFADEFGFSRVELTRNELSVADARAELAQMCPSLETMSELLGLSANLPLENAKKLCGLRGRVGLINASPGKLTAGSRASFSPEELSIKVSANANSSTCTGRLCTF
jgi:hypothetical protein